MYEMIFVTVPFAYAEEQEVPGAEIPSSTAISCYYKTFIAGSMDYQYRTKVYSLKNNKGAYAPQNTYEHFVVI
ncbi:hypothetical protein [Aminicella lysinilytica]|uniref:hypothetical protein n=1 Tax=Aminicella lysinilytica TaxID=433323 RepID=UPI0026EBBD6A|nr:hypothetical protein [Aminicella lysinilytica]